MSFVKAGELKVGDRLSETQYYEVIRLEDNEVHVRNERGYEFGVSREIVEEGMVSAGQYTHEEKVTRTRLCEILEQAGDCIFTVNFQKKVKERELLEELFQAVQGEHGLGDDELQGVLRKATHKAMQGEERTLVGYLLSAEPKMGRSQVIDLEISEAKHRIRLVDHRTLNWLILKNVKYSCK